MNLDKKTLNRIGCLLLVLLGGLAGLAGLWAATPAPVTAGQGTGSGEPVAGGEIMLAAAASLADAMGELIGLHGQVAPGVRVLATYGASGSLQKQIEQGAPVDLFISAAPRQMDALAARGLVVPGTRRDLLANEVVLVVPAGNPRKLSGFADLAGSQVGQLALGEPASVPVGQYAAQILAWLKLGEALAGKVVYAKDVRQVLAYVERGEVDAGLVYATDAALSSKVTVVAAAPAGSHAPVLYPAALVSAGLAPVPAQARRFLDWLAGPAAAQVFKKYGFVVRQTP